MLQPNVCFNLTLLAIVSFGVDNQRQFQIYFRKKCETSFSKLDKYI